MFLDFSKDNRIACPFLSNFSNNSCKLHSLFNKTICIENNFEMSSLFFSLLIPVFLSISLRPSLNEKDALGFKSLSMLVLNQPEACEKRARE